MLIPCRTPKTAPEGTVARSQLAAADPTAEAGGCAGANTLAHPASETTREAAASAETLGMDGIASTGQVTEVAEEMILAG